MVSQTPRGAVQSVLLLHGSLMQVPREPSVVVQYSPVAQLVAPLSPTTRHPGVHTPVLVVEVSQ
jgi:hypothetical protein